MNHNTSHNPGLREERRLSSELLDEPSTLWLPVVVGLLDRQGVLCDRLEMLSREQAAHVRDRRGDALVGVLADRQRVIDDVLDANAQLELFRTRRARLFETLSPADRQSVESKIEQIAQSVERVRTQDESDRAALEEQRKVVTDELTGLVRGRGAVAAYGGNARIAAAAWSGGGDVGGGRHG